MTTSTPTREDLDARLTAAREAIAEAERNLGAATLDGKGQSAAQKAVEAAQHDERVALAAIEELTRREETQAAEEAVEASRQKRIAIYKSAAERLPLVADVIAARETLATAEAALKAHALYPRLRRLLASHSEKVMVDGKWTRRLWSESELDFYLLQGIPNPQDAFREMTVERCAELEARARELVEAEERGEGERVTVTGEAWARERRERRQRKVAEREAREAKEREERDRREAEEIAKRDRAHEAKQRELKGNASERAALLKREGE